MNRSKFFFTHLLLLFVLAGCNNSETNRPDYTYFGGHIVNPTSEFLVLSDDITAIDTAFLTDKKDFSFELENLEEGLYNFQHGYESQVIYLTPGDSLLMWVNTLGFDESIYFSGTGAEVNNFLIEIYLQNKKNTDLVLDYYRIKPAAFEKIADSIQQHRLDQLQDFALKKNIDKNFIGIAEKMIQYEKNNLKEKYTFLVQKYYPRFSGDFPNDFFDYRDGISFNERSFQSNPAYLQLLDNYLLNLSMQDCKGNPQNNSCYDQNSHSNILKRIELADSLITLPSIRNHFFNLLASTGLIMGKNRDELVEILNIVKQKGIPKKDLNNLVTLGSIQLAFIPGINMGDTPLINGEGNKVDLSEIIDRRTIFFLWSINSPRLHKSQHVKIKELRKKYPDIDFLGINIDIGETSAWKNALQKYGYDIEKEYQLDTIRIRDVNIGADVFNNYLNKILFLDASGTVVIGDAYLHSPEFESRVLEFLNL